MTHPRPPWVFFCIPWSFAEAGGHGGLGFSAAETGVVLAVAVAALAVPRYCSAAAVLRVTARSPVRTLRVATSLQVRE